MHSYWVVESIIACAWKKHLYSYCRLPLDGGGGAPHPALLKPLQKSRLLGAWLASSYCMGFQNFIVINKIHLFKIYIYIYIHITIVKGNNSVIYIEYITICTIHWHYWIISWIKMHLICNCKCFFCISVPYADCFYSEVTIKSNKWGFLQQPARISVRSLSFSLPSTNLCKAFAFLTTKKRRRASLKLTILD